MTTPSALIADRYRLVKLLGAGGMGVVWQAWDERLHRPVALKMLRAQPELSDAERQRATDRAMREARINAGLHHPHAVTVFDVIQHEGRPCIVMQLVESTPLSVLLTEHGTLSVSETARVGAQVSSALAAAHKLRIVHRDIKPGNILITADGSAMISDFGISHALGDATITATGVIHGTPAYLAPEAARGLPANFASDVFSLGSTMYAMLEGSPPFGSDKNAIALLHKVAKGGHRPAKHAGPLGPLLGEMLATNPKRRPTMASIAESLLAVQEVAGSTAPALAGAAVLSGEAVAGTPTVRLDEGTTEAYDDPPPTPATIPVTDAATTLSEDPSPTAETLAAPDAAMAKTIPVDQPTRYHAPTAETEPLGPASPRTAARPELVPVKTAPPEGPSTRPGRRIGVIVGILILLGALAVGVVMLFNATRPGVDGTAPRTASQVPSASEPAETPSAEPSPSASPPPEESPPAEEAPNPPPTQEQRVVDTIAGYYALLPTDLDGAWPLMTADYQENHAGGRGGYEAFWSQIDQVAIADVMATAPDRAQATLTYYFSDGRVVQEVTSYRLVEEGGLLKIAETAVLSSTQL